ncbi:MAG: hypothetical protein WC797_04290, partial [Candidatus Paceibacterota bacterium]
MILTYLEAGLVDTANSFVDMLVYTLPIGLVVLCFLAWSSYVRALFLSKVKWVLLEIKLPKNIYKSPKAMEIVLTSLYQAGNPNWYDRYWGGKVRLWSSLELVSIGGDVHFFVRITDKIRNTVESHLYSQFPGLEVHEVVDYVYKTDYLRSGGQELFGVEYKLSKEDPYPIKTYIDYGVDKDPAKEEYRIDPMVATLEFLGSLGQSEQVWMQILVMAAKSRFSKQGKWFEKGDWKEEAKVIVDKIMKRDKESRAKELSSSMASPGERAVAEAVERSVSKLGFDCGIRTLYIAPKDKLDTSRVVSMAGALRQYNTLHLNGFKGSISTQFDWWEDPLGWKLTKRKRNIFKAYCERAFFYPPFERKPFVLNTEELATIFHFPGQVAEVPTFARLESK